MVKALDWRGTELDKPLNGRLRCFLRRKEKLCDPNGIRTRATTLKG